MDWCNRDTSFSTTRMRVLVQHKWLKHVRSHCTSVHLSSTLHCSGQSCVAYGTIVQMTSCSLVPMLLRMLRSNMLFDLCACVRTGDQRNTTALLHLPTCEGFRCSSVFHRVGAACSFHRLGAPRPLVT